VIWLVLARALAVVGAGAAVGAVASAVLVRYVRGLLYEVDASDPLVILSAAAALLCVMLAATFVPARRAASVNPVTALRAE
jgi:ABC-type antimicrobial peptide transport system permease subunit